MTVSLLLLVSAQAFDYLSFLVMAGRHGLAAEANPLVVSLAEQYGLPGVTAAKLAVVALVALTAIVISPQRRKIAAVVLLAGIGTGALGGISNVASI